MPTIEIDIDKRHKEMFEELKQKMGEDTVENEYTKLIQKSIYRSLYNENGDGERMRNQSR